MPRHRRPISKSPPNQQGSLRIIGGQWRSRKLHFTTAEGLRPTGDRIRETLFNWLTTDIAGARCLDLFAGSGALGLEALSRGAASCDLVELNRQSAKQIQAHLQTLDANNGQVHCQHAEDFLASSSQHFDIIFLDPPFHKGLIETLSKHITKRLSLNGLIYLEQSADEEIPIPQNWVLEKQKKAGEVIFSLWRIRD